MTLNPEQLLARVADRYTYAMPPGVSLPADVLAQWRQAIEDHEQRTRARILDAALSLPAMRDEAREVVDRAELEQRLRAAAGVDTVGALRRHVGAIDERLILHATDDPWWGMLRGALVELWDAIDVNVARTRCAEMAGASAVAAGAAVMWGPKVPARLPQGSERTLSAALALEPFTTAPALHAVWLAYLWPRVWWEWRRDHAAELAVRCVPLDGDETGRSVGTLRRLREAVEEHLPDAEAAVGWPRRPEDVPPFAVNAELYELDERALDFMDGLPRLAVEGRGRVGALREQARKSYAEARDATAVERLAVPPDVARQLPKMPHPNPADRWKVAPERLAGLLALVLWHGRVKPALERERARSAPAVPDLVSRRLLNIDTAPGRRIEGSAILNARGEVVARLATDIAPQALEWLSVETLKATESMAAELLLRFIVEQSWRQHVDGGDPGSIIVRGGLSGLARALDLPDKGSTRNTLRANLNWWWRGEFRAPDRTVYHGLLNWTEPPDGADGRRRMVIIEPSTALQPLGGRGYLVPVPSHKPPFVGRNDQLPAQMRLQWLVVRHIAERAGDLVETGAVDLTTPEWFRLADEAGLPRTTASKAARAYREGSAKSPKNPPMLADVSRGGTRVTLTEHYKRELEALRERGRYYLTQSERGKLSSRRRRGEGVGSLNARARPRKKP